MKIIKQKEQKISYKYSLVYNWKDNPMYGFSFDCDEKGNLIINELSETGLENYNKCKNGEYNVICKGIKKDKLNYTEPAIGLCNVCNTEVILDRFTNTCEKCGTDYNMGGQQLALRSQWGEETGENLSDILGIK